MSAAAHMRAKQTELNEIGVQYSNIHLAEFYTFLIGHKCDLV